MGRVGNWGRAKRNARMLHVVRAHEPCTDRSWFERWLERWDDLDLGSGYCTNGKPAAHHASLHIEATLRHSHTTHQHNGLDIRALIEADVFRQASLASSRRAWQTLATSEDDDGLA
jgi:hypothetical protein